MDDRILLPCPFCGTEPVFQTYHPALHPGTIMIYYKHEPNGCIMDGIEIPPEDVGAWNRRSGPVGMPGPTDSITPEEAEHHGV